MTKKSTTNQAPTFGSPRAFTVSGPLDAYPDPPQTNMVHPILPKNMLYLFLVAGAIGMLFFASDYLTNRRERLEKKAAYDRANATERNAKEQQRREYQKPNIDKQMREFRLP